jgi:hypothetical protein
MPESVLFVKRLPAPKYRPALQTIDTYAVRYYLAGKEESADGNGTEKRDAGRD